MIRTPVADSRIAFSFGRLACRVALLASLLLLPTSCGPAAQAETRPAIADPGTGNHSTTPSFTEREFIASDGTRLPLRKWLPRGPVKAAVLALHGFNDYSYAFEIPAKTWAARGIATYAYDQRGFGGAPDGGSWAGEGRLAVDAITAIRVLRRTYPGRPVYLLGESMGGAVAILAATGTMSGVVAGTEGMPRAEADGVILSAPAVWGRATMDLLPKAALFLAVRFFPTKVLSGRGLGIRISDNDAVLRQMASDPLVIKGTRVDAVYGVVDLMDSALEAAPLLDVPLLLMYGARDEVMPRRPIAEFVAHLPAEPRQPRRLAYYPAGYHLLLRDLKGGIVATDIASWIAEPRAPLPSKADAAAAVSPWPPAPEGGAAAPEVSRASPASATPRAVINPRG
ncbi:MAG TPA: alpha/beta hydrolase [Stellaceae bacterium]|nr:alpha/beta hydrolase [Stellaceae bacterium]